MKVFNTKKVFGTVSFVIGTLLVLGNSNVARAEASIGPFGAKLRISASVDFLPGSNMSYFFNSQDAPNSANACVVYLKKFPTAYSELSPRDLNIDADKTVLNCPALPGSVEFDIYIKDDVSVDEVRCFKFYPSDVTYGADSDPCSNDMFSGYNVTIVPNPTPQPVQF